MREFRDSVKYDTYSESKIDNMSIGDGVARTMVGTPI